MNTVFNTIQNIVRKNNNIIYFNFFLSKYCVSFVLYIIQISKSSVGSFTISFRIKTLVFNLNISIIYTVELEHYSNINRIAIISVKQEMLTNVKKIDF